MLTKLLLVLCFASVLHASLGDEPRRATVYLFGSGISGTVIFSEVEEGLRLSGTITGMDAGRYGFHIHEVGDVSHCDNTAGHFDPHGRVHGGQDHQIRHVGDLGNVEFNAQRQSQIDILEPLMTLRGENSILGRALVLHVQEDDLGQGGNAESLVTGNAGARAACGVVGVLSPVTPWNAAGAVSAPYLLLLVVSALMLAIRL